MPFLMLTLLVDSVGRMMCSRKKISVGVSINENFRRSKGLYRERESGVFFEFLHSFNPFHSFSAAHTLVVWTVHLQMEFEVPPTDRRKVRMVVIDDADRLCSILSILPIQHTLVGNTAWSKWTNNTETPNDRFLSSTERLVLATDWSSCPPRALARRGIFFSLHPDSLQAFFASQEGLRVVPWSSVAECALHARGGRREGERERRGGVVVAVGRSGPRTVP